MTCALMCQPLVNLHSLKGCQLISRYPTFHVGFLKRLSRGVSTIVAASDQTYYTLSVALF